jgi:SecD/SecF fusion protein
MQNKGAIKFFAIAFAIVSAFQLSFTFFTNHIENKATAYATSEVTTQMAKDLSKGDKVKETVLYDSLVKARERYYLDSMQNEVVYNILIRKYTYKECKDREINLGLDLKGGMNVTLEISVVDVIKEMSNNSQNKVFLKAIDKANELEKSSTKDYVTLFGEAIKTIDPGFKLSSVFNTVDLKDKVNYNSTNDEVLAVIKTEANDAIDRTFNILRTRIDKFGVTQPNIQKLSTAGRILVELPGVKEPNRVRKILQSTAKLEFWETYECKDVFSYLEDANKKLVLISKGDTTAKDTSKADIKKAGVKGDKTALAKTEKKSLKINKDSTKKTSAEDTSLISKLKKGDTTAKGKDLANQQSFEEYAKKNPLFAYLRPAIDQKDGKSYFSKGPVVGYCAIIDTIKVNKMLAMDQVKAIFPNSLKFMWDVKAFDDKKTTLRLYAIHVTNHYGNAPIDGSAITDARQDLGQNSSNEISMSMNTEGAKTWKRLTADNIGKCIAIALDNYIYSAPVVQGEIPNGHSSITGQFTIDEAKDLANVLKAGKLPAPAKIVEEAIVGPTLGKEAINAGFWSFIVAFILTMIFMVFYYNRSGMVADIALFVNMFFVFGILASLGAVLTLPGIAGLVLTLGMDVDKNVIIYERIREEIRAGKGIRLAVNDGYKHALSAIIDSNVTTLLTGIVLYIFGSGPVQGFATTLIIGIISSLFCAIFITRLIFIWMMDKNMEIKVWNKMTKNFLTNVHIDFIGVRKTFYVVSLLLVVAGVISLSTKGLRRGIDFLGGRTFVVRFDNDIKTEDLSAALGKQFEGNIPEVKTFGPSNQVKITTSYKIEDKTTSADSIVETKLYKGLKPYFHSSITQADFMSHDEKKTLGKLSSQKVEPTIAYSLLKQAFYAVFFSLMMIFIYIAIRFKKWQWGLGGVVSLFHDTFIVISIFSIFNGLLPFSLEIGQDFIAAILTIIGYSIMDSVIIFDRIREYQTLYPKRDMKTNMNDAINSTLSRTLNTSGITFMVLLSMFIFGGETIRGFAFALLIGVVIGTYSSVLNATPVAYDTLQWIERRKAKKALLNPKK